MDMKRQNLWIDNKILDKITECCKINEVGERIHLEGSIYFIA